MAPIAGPFPPQLCSLSDRGSSLRRTSCGDGPGLRPQEAMARKSVPSVDSRSGHPQMAPIAGPFPPRPGFSPRGSSLRRAWCGDGPGLRPQEAMARKSVASVDSRSRHPQMAPIAGPFPPRLCFPPTETRRCEEHRAATGQGHAQNKHGPEIGGICGQQIWSSTNGTDCRPIPAAALFPPDGGSSPRRPSCGDGPGRPPQKGIARKSVASVDSRSGHPQMAPIAGPFPPRRCFPPAEARRCAGRRAATGRGGPHKKE
jgi:hypothetical protein